METDLKVIEHELDRLTEFHQLKTTPEKAARYGELLKSAKAVVPHGEWSAWLKLRGIKPRTAQVWMQISSFLKNASAAEFDTNSIAGILSLAAKGRDAVIKERRDELAQLDTGNAPDDIHVVHDDFRSLAHIVEPESCHLAVIDPPYKIHDFYGEAAELASSMLVQGGLAFAYCANPDIGIVIASVEQHLRFTRCFGIFHVASGSGKHNFVPTWHPVLVFQKGTMKTPCGVSDAFMSEGLEKDRHHAWQQDFGALRYWISKLTKPRQQVVDFFCGGGTIPLVCNELSRICYSTDVDESCIKAVRALLTEKNQCSTTAEQLLKAS